MENCGTNIFHFLFDMSEEYYLEWMWGDAGILGMPGMNYVASLNPYRWSKGDSDSIIRDLLQHSETERPVELRVIGEKYSHSFVSPKAAISWIESCKDTNITKGNSLYTFGTTFALWTAPGALALFCRLHSKQAWTKKNLFNAGIYANYVTNIPYELSKRQRIHGLNPKFDAILKEEKTWDEFFSLCDYGRLVEITSLPKDERIGEILFDSKKWILQENEEYFTIFQNKESKEAIITFRGGDGGAEDAKNHPGSPARIFVNGYDANALPSELGSDFIESLGETGYSITIVGYSQGGILALAAAIKYAKHSYIKKCILLNCATQFWPPWMNQLLPDGVGEIWKNVNTIDEI